MSVALVWFRNDLRLGDNPALTAALKAGHAIVPIYVLDDETAGLRPLGAASRWWLHHSLKALDESLRALGSHLVLKRGTAEKIIPALAADCGASAIYWNRNYEEGARLRDGRLKETFSKAGVKPESFKANLLFEPWEVTTHAGSPFKVFTPFWKACRTSESPAKPLPAPRRIAPPTHLPAGEELATWRLLPTKPDWAGGMRATWHPGECSALMRLHDFLDHFIERYPRDRDLPAVEGTSRLSPHLAFGEISPRQIWHACMSRERNAAVEKFLSELGWREFAYHLIFHFGDLARRNFRSEFDVFEWANDQSSVEAWQKGRTGYPIVDAGMRELWTTGWMHNRVRMIVASFLTKDLLVDWRIGERWFWDTLVDADPANNATGWQWVAGCGADAAPFFRVFNPVLQGEKFDPQGDYVRRWIPELSHLPASDIHKPWAAASPPSSGTYPQRIVDHGTARDRALAIYRSLKQAA